MIYDIIYIIDNFRPFFCHIFQKHHSRSEVFHGMKHCKRLLALFLLLATVATLVTVFPATAAAATENTQTGENQTRYTQKVVAVVYDNSGSMLQSVNKEEERTHPAEYSLSMLLSMLNEKDEMILMPMNNAPTQGIPVKLSDPDRNKILNEIISNPALKSNGGQLTPKSSMTYAINQLKERGLKREENLIDQDPSKEFWLVILTDGGFETSSDPAVQAGYIEDAISAYPTLRTVYVSFGGSAVDVSKEETLKKYAFTPYCKVPVSLDNSNGDNLVTVIQKISNQISGRYPLTQGQQYRVDGNTVTVDLSQIKFSLSSLSVIAQNCGATVTGAKYSGGTESQKNENISLKKVCTITPNKALNIKNGCSFEVACDTYMYGGSLTLTFDNPVQIDQLSIFAEPALNISHYYEAQISGDWQRVDLAYVNSNLGEKDKIRVGYEVTEQATGSVIDLGQIFGDVKSKVTYNRTEYTVGQEIPLVVGTNEIALEVSVMNGAYTLRTSEIITIEKDPSYFRVEVEGDDEINPATLSASATFTVFVNNQPATKEVLKEYVCTATAVSSDGDVLFEKQVTPDGSGKITVPIQVEKNKYKTFTVSLHVLSPHKTTREASHEITYVPTSLDLAVNGDDRITVSQYDLKNCDKSFGFALTTNGEPFPFRSSILEYTLTVNGKDVTESTSVSDNLLSYTPDEAGLGGMPAPGEYDVVLTLKSKKYPNLDTSAAAKLIVTQTVFTVVPLSGSVKDLDRFDLENSNAVLYFTVEHDGVPFTAEELQQSLDNGDLTVENTPLFDFFLFPAGLTLGIEETDGTAALAVRAVKDMPTYFEWHLSAFITGGDKQITVRYAAAADPGTDAFFVVDSSIFQHILRITLLILVIIWIINFILFLISLFTQFYLNTKPKALPKGTVVIISATGTTFKEINTGSVKHVLLNILWMVARLLLPIPGYTFLAQSLIGQDSPTTDYQYTFDNENELHFLAKANGYYRIDAGTELSNYCSTLRTGTKRIKFKDFYKIHTKKDLDEKRFSKQADQGEKLAAGAICTVSSGSFYAVYKKDARDRYTVLKNIVTFIPKN